MRKIIGPLLIGIVVCLAVIVPSKAAYTKEDACKAYYELIQQTIDDRGKKPSNSIVLEKGSSFTYDVVSSVAGAKLEDWNNDGVPELLLRTKFADSLEMKERGASVVLIGWNGERLVQLFCPKISSSGLIELCRDGDGNLYYPYSDSGADNGLSVRSIPWGDQPEMLEIVYRLPVYDWYVSEFYHSISWHYEYRYVYDGVHYDISKKEFDRLYNLFKSYTPVTYSIPYSDSVEGTLKELSSYVDPEYASHYRAPSSWAKAGVDQAVSAGYVPSSLQKKYAEPITRAEFCSLAVKFYEAVAPAPIEARAKFTDTSSVEVQKMGGLGIIKGYGDGKFGPNDLLTREQAAVILSNFSSIAFKNPMAASSPSFADRGTISSWAVDKVGEVAKAEIMNGVGSNRFDPKGHYTREQSILTMLRMASRIVPVSSVVINEKDTVETEVLAGQTVKLTAAMYPDNAFDPKLKGWSTSNSTVATVDNGVVTMRGAGDATITVTTDNGCKDSVTFHVLPADHIDLQASLPAKVSFLYTTDTLYSKGPGDEYRAGGTLEVDGASWGKSSGIYSSNGIIVTGRLLSLEDDLDNPVPYLHYVFKNKAGETVDEGYRSLDKTLRPGDTFEAFLRISDLKVVFGEAYTVSFVSDEGQTRSERKAEEPKIILPELPFNVPDKTYNNGPRGMITITDVDYDLSYESRYDKYKTQITISCEGDLYSEDRVPHYTFRMDWYLMDSSGQTLRVTQREYFLGVKQGEFSVKLGSFSELKGGETYRLVFELV